MITEVNYFGVVYLLEAWRPALAAATRAKVVVFSSNSTTTVPAVPGRAVRALLARRCRKGPADVQITRTGRPADSLRGVEDRREPLGAPPRCHCPVGRRRYPAERPGAGAIMTPMLERQLATPAEARNIRRFPVPIGGFGDPLHLAEWVVFMLSDSADFLCGSVVFVDGGSDAYYRCDDWPRSVPLRRLPSYLLYPPIREEPVVKIVAALLLTATPLLGCASKARSPKSGPQTDSQNPDHPDFLRRPDESEAGQPKHHPGNRRNSSR